MKFATISACRVCGDENLVDILFMGDQPLANGLKKHRDEAEAKFPLTLVFCRNCGLVQIKETVNKETLFDRYFWITGTSQTARQFANTFYENAVAIANPENGDLVVEIASNDGTFLKPFIDNNYTGVGVDPAKNIAEIANSRGIKTIDSFWNTDTAEKVSTEHGNAKIIIARNVIPHVSELNEVIAGIQLALADDGVGIIEFHYANNILKGMQYDSIYHEHLCYFSIKTIERLLNKFDMFTFHIILSPISGGAYAVCFSKERRPVSVDYNKMVKKEAELGVNDIQAWREFAEKAIEHKRLSIETLKLFKDKKVIGFGASARSSTYLNFCGFSDSEIAMIIDNNKIKQGFYTPGSSIPIVTFDEGLANGPELIFILAWNFTDEIVSECESKGYSKSYMAAFPEKPYIREPRLLYD